MIFVLILHFVINCVGGGRNSRLVSHSVSIPEGETCARIVRILLMENVGSKMTMALVYLTARNYRIISCYCK